MTTTTKERKSKTAKAGRAPSIAAELDDRGPWDEWTETGETAGISDIRPAPIHVQALRPHPSNRMPAEADVALLAESILRNGLLDPILVRKLPGDPQAYQILSGETRWRAVRKLGWEAIDCRVCEVDDVRALVIVAEANEQRCDLTTVQKATLIQQLCRPVSEGGGGLTRAAAARVFKLESASAASNLVKLLEAPPAWRRRLDTPDKTVHGEPVVVHQATVREVAKWSQWPEIIDAIEEGYRKETLRGVKFLTREEQLDAVESWVMEAVRETSGTRYYGWQLGDHPCYLDLQDAELRKELRVVDLPVGKDGQLEPCALNVKLFDDLQGKEIEKRKKAGAKTKAAKEPAAPLSPAEERKAAKAKRKEQDEQLVRWAGEWRLRMLRATAAEMVDEDDAAWLLPWLLIECRGDYRIPPDELLEYVCAGVDGYDSDVRGNPLAQLLAIHRAAAGPACRSRVIRAIRLKMVRLLLWPQDPASTNPSLVATDLPERMLSLESDDVDQLAAWLDLSIEDCWNDGAVDGSTQRALIAELLNRHTSEQLADLAEELGVELSAAKKGQAVAELMSAHKPGKPLPLPALLAPKTPRKRK